MCVRACAHASPCVRACISLCDSMAYLLKVTGSVWLRARARARARAKYWSLQRAQAKLHTQHSGLADSPGSSCINS